MIAQNAIMMYHTENFSFLSIFSMTREYEKLGRKAIVRGGEPATQPIERAAANGFRKQDGRKRIVGLLAGIYRSRQAIIRLQMLEDVGLHTCFKTPLLV